MYKTVSGGKVYISERFRSGFHAVLVGLSRVGAVWVDFGRLRLCWGGFGSRSD